MKPIDSRICDAGVHCESCRDLVDAGWRVSLRPDAPDFVCPRGKPWGWKPEPGSAPAPAPARDKWSLVDDAREKARKFACDIAECAQWTGTICEQVGNCLSSQAALFRAAERRCPLGYWIEDTEMQPPAEVAAQEK